MGKICDGCENKATREHEWKGLNWFLCEQCYTTKMMSDIIKHYKKLKKLKKLAPLPKNK